jgi:hypothetical protein
MKLRPTLLVSMAALSLSLSQPASSADGETAKAPVKSKTLNGDALKAPNAAAATEGTLVAEADTSGDDDAKKRTPLDKKQIRKLLSAEPDPSMVLEPPPEPPPTKAPVVKKPNPKAALPSMTPTTVVTKPSSGLKGIPGQIPLNPELAIILVDKQFFPSKIRLKEGVQTRLFFTTTNEKPAAIVIEQMQIQRWVAKEGEQAPPTEADRAKWEASKEVNRNRVTEILIEPRKGSYSIFDVITGAKGQVIVE